MRHTITLPLALALFLGTTGCMSVSPPENPPLPNLAPAQNRSPAPVESSRPAQSPAREELAATGPEDTPESTKSSAQQDRSDDRPAPGRAAADPFVHGPGAPEDELRRPRTQPRLGVRPLRPRQDFNDMRGLCAASDGVAKSPIVELCRNTYGR
ncbi:hypothetical protein [Streptomyces sp. NPDC058280]|uniref:hypothetical protein n=1 Tax=Streptomyces sp. NPDC058280 TaxID=3346419 RepID=UPI0036E38B8B